MQLRKEKRNRNKHSDITEDDFCELLDRYDDENIKNAFREMYPNVAKKIEEIKKAKDKKEHEIKVNEFEKMRIDNESFEKAFQALYPRENEEKMKEMEDAINYDSEVKKVDDKNKRFNKLIRSAANNNVRSAANNENIEKKIEDKKVDMNDLIRQKYRKSHIVVNNFFKKR